MAITLNGTTGISTPNITSTTAPSLVGTNFTSLPSASLTGALPAIDGSALTGVGGNYGSGNTSPSGTWQIMGHSGIYNGTIAFSSAGTSVSVYVRIS